MLDSRREFIKKASLLAGATGLFNVLPLSIQKALAIEADPGTTYLDAEHVVFLMQENRSFDHCYGALKGVRGFNDPRAIKLPNGNPVWLQTNKEGKTYAPWRLDIKNSKATWMGSLPHSWGDQVDARNNGRFDTWLEAKKAGNPAYAHMPLTMGYYDRADIPFYYALADAFTVCDQHFCSSLTGTSANRSYFWSGTIRENPHDEKSPAHVWNGDINYKDVSWTSFPERLEKAGIPWKVYQNELSIPVGFEGEEEDWLANFTDNNLEFFKQYNVRLHPQHLAFLDKMGEALPVEIKKLQKELRKNPADKGLSEQLQKKHQQMEQVLKAKKIYNKDKFDELSDFEKSIHKRAFVTNVDDPDYHKLSSLSYDDEGVRREVKLPKGDIFHQFRTDVNKGELPTVSWLVAPCNFSDHPGAPWYGAWYVSEALDILTRNPDVWKKTIFILTYDENDGYFDHVPPFIPPRTDRPYTGAASAGIDTTAEWVTLEQKEQKGMKEDERWESPIGLGYRVPLVIASPWSRGGFVNSQIFDLTSSLMFLEKFFSGKTGKNVFESNITEWRRTICGDLTSVFRPFRNEKIEYPEFLKRDDVIEGVHEAQFKSLPGNFRVFPDLEIAQIMDSSAAAEAALPCQEKGVKEACAIPYETYVDALLDHEKSKIVLGFKVGTEIFGDRSAGTAFNVYAPGKFRLDKGSGVFEAANAHNWAFAVKAGDEVPYSWDINDFESKIYHLRVYGANGFYREFRGSKEDPALAVAVKYETGKKGELLFTGNLVLQLTNNDKHRSYEVLISDISYGGADVSVVIASGDTAKPAIGLKQSYGWYDIGIEVKGFSDYKQQYAGHVETGITSITDPLMGRVTD